MKNSKAQKTGENTNSSNGQSSTLGTSEIDLNDNLKEGSNKKYNINVNYISSRKKDEKLQILVIRKKRARTDYRTAEPNNDQVEHNQKENEFESEFFPNKKVKLDEEKITKDLEKIHIFNTSNRLNQEKPDNELTNENFHKKADKTNKRAFRIFSENNLLKPNSSDKNFNISIEDRKLKDIYKNYYPIIKDEDENKNGSIVENISYKGSLFSNATNNLKKSNISQTQEKMHSDLTECRQLKFMERRALLSRETLVNFKNTYERIFGEAKFFRPQNKDHEMIIINDNTKLSKEQINEFLKESHDTRNLTCEIFEIDKKCITDGITYEQCLKLIQDQDLVSEVLSESDDNREDDYDSNVEDNPNNDYPDEFSDEEDEQDDEYNFMFNPKMKNNPYMQTLNKAKKNMDKYYKNGENSDDSNNEYY